MTKEIMIKRDEIMTDNTVRVIKDTCEHLYAKRNENIKEMDTFKFKIDLKNVRS